MNLVRYVKLFPRLFSLVLVILLGEAILTGLLPHSRGYVFDMLEEHNIEVWYFIIIYFLNYFFLDFCQAIKGYFTTKFALHARNYRTEEVISKIGEGTNLPQRIQEDIKKSFEDVYKVYAEYFVSGLIIVQLYILNLDTPVLLICATAYALFSVGLAKLFNPRLTRAEKMIQETEASYRSDLVKDMSDISAIENVLTVNMKARLIETEYLLFTRLQFGLLNVLPYIVLIPSFFAGDMTLGTLIKHQATFALIVVNAAILVSMYPKFISGKASEERYLEVLN